MDFDFSFAFVFLNGHLSSERLFQRMNRCFDVRVDIRRRIARIIRCRFGITGNQRFRLPDGVIPVDDLSGGVEYRIEVR